MPGPSSDQSTSQTRGPATPEEVSAFRQASEQAGVAGQAAQGALFNPEQQLAQFEVNRQRIQDAIKTAEYDITHLDAYGGEPMATARARSLLRDEINRQTANLAALEASKPMLEKQAARYQEQEDLNKRVQSRLDDFISGRDIGVSPQEQALITQGIQGISQDVATTRGLNRTDVPVMQAVAPTVAQALLNQANANRSLFTGINQFQQGLDLSNRQLQGGLAGQNPAANLTGVYAGLRPSSFTTSTQQGYGALDYVNAGAQLAKGVGSAMTGFADQGLTMG